MDKSRRREQERREFSGLSDDTREKVLICRAKTYEIGPQGGWLHGRTRSARDRNRSWNIAVLILAVLSGVVAGAFAVVAGGSEDSWPGVVAGVAGAVAGAAAGAEAGFKFASKTAHNEVKGADFGHVAAHAKNALASNKSAEALERVVERLTDRMNEIEKRSSP